MRSTFILLFVWLALALTSGCDSDASTERDVAIGDVTATADGTAATGTDTAERDTVAGDASGGDTSAGDTAATDASGTATDAGDATLGDGSGDTAPSDASDSADVPVDTRLDDLLTALRADPEATLLGQSAVDGWPAPVEGGYLFVSTEPGLTLVGGDHDNWTGTQMTVETGFAWIVLDVPAGSRYKFTDLNTWQADPWSRAYEYDDFGEMSLVPPLEAHRERFFEVSDATLVPRRVRVWVPAASDGIDRVLYVADGQNLFEPDAIFGGWRLDETTPPGTLVVGIDNTGALRMDEYTHVPDLIESISPDPIGGQGDAYATFWHETVRPLVDTRYGEPAVVGVMGSSLGGLISLHIADRYPSEVDFVASLSGTVGWGSFGLDNETMIERYAAAGKRDFVVYLDSGGGGTCVDSDGDGIEDDAPDGADNYCENKQLEGVLLGLGYTSGVDLHHWWEPDAPHNEAAWADRVWRPLGIFDGL